VLRSVSELITFVISLAGSELSLLIILRNIVPPIRKYQGLIPLKEYL